MAQPASPADASGRQLILRLFAGALALLALPSAFQDFYGLVRGGFDPLLAIFGACTILFMVMCGWFALRGNLTSARARMKTVILGGVVVGAIGFAIGFLGPMIWAPGANQGPLLGIFITGPIGFVVGAALGWFYSRTRSASS
jgi:hypothetical protein